MYIFASEKNNFLEKMSKDIKLKKGLNINLSGEADKVYANVAPSNLYVVKPTDFHGLTPKLVVKEGDKVMSGSTLFFDKYNEAVKFSSPVSGTVTSIVRGAKRRIMEVVITSDSEINYRVFDKVNSDDLSRKQIVDYMLESGVWPFIRQKPYDIIANQNDTPKAIVISSFNTEPLSADNDFVLHGLEKEFQSGIQILKKLTDGKVHLNVDSNTNPSKVFTDTQGVEINKFSGPHPSGNVGVQIHHIDPINKGDVVWYLYPQDVLAISRLFAEGKYDVSRIVALTGSQVMKPRYYRIIAGASITNMIEDNVKAGDSRFISGSALTGNQISSEGAIGFYDTQVTVIPEGNYQEFLGWLAPGLNKFSMSKAYFSWLSPSKKYDLDTNYHGEERAYVVTGQYEQVLPMDIYPMQLIKACLIEDIEAMENLGIYEVSPEDLALCEFVCTSKMEVQSIIRKGLDLIKKECS
jgi:Na+-transporting NADH:ubiquinone oxidoreductase subunit A